MTIDNTVFITPNPADVSLLQFVNYSALSLIWTDSIRTTVGLDASVSDPCGLITHEVLDSSGVALDSTVFTTNDLTSANK